MSEDIENAIRSACQRAIDRASHHLAQPNVDGEHFLAEFGGWGK